MAKISIAKASGLLDAEWDLSPVMRELTRLRHSQDDKPKGIVVSGTDLREYIPSLMRELRQVNSIILSDPQELVGALNRNGAYGEDISRMANLIPNDLISKTLSEIDRLGRIDFQNSEYISAFSKIDKIYSPSLFDKIFSAHERGFSDRILAYGASRLGTDVTYYDAILPLLVKKFTSTVWVLFGTNSISSRVSLPQFERDYIDWNQIVDKVAEEKGVDPAQLRFVLETNIPPPPMYSKKNAGKISAGAANNFFDYYSRYITDDLNVVLDRFPKPLSAPFEFIVNNSKLSTNRRTVRDLIKNDPTNIVLMELIDQINDVTDVYNLSNSAPILAQKLRRLKDTLHDVSDNPTEPMIIRAGIINESIKSYLPFESENIDEAAEGGITTSIRQIDLFLNRLRAWRDYLWEIERPIDAVSNEVAEKAVELLTAIKDSGAAIEHATSLDVEKYLEDATAEGASEPEREGLVRSAQNALAVVANYISDQVKDGIRNSPKNLVGEAIKIASFAALATLMLKMEATIVGLAKSYTILFGWVFDFLAWLKVIA